MPRDLIDLSGRGFGVTYVDDGETYYEWSVANGDDVVPVGVGIGGPANGTIVGGSLDYNGELISFASSADNLVSGDDNIHTDVFTRPVETYYES